MDYRRSLVRRDAGGLTVSRQCELLGLPRSSYYAGSKRKGTGSPRRSAP